MSYLRGMPADREIYIKGKGMLCESEFCSDHPYPHTLSAVPCSLNAHRLGGVKFGFWLTGKLDRTWVGAWRGAWYGMVHGMVNGMVRVAWHCYM